MRRDRGWTAMRTNRNGSRTLGIFGLGEKLAAGWKLPARASLKDMRALSAADIIAAEPVYFRNAVENPPPFPNLGIIVDGYVAQGRMLHAARVAAPESPLLRAGSGLCPATCDVGQNQAHEDDC
jgi:hypothetical protein